MPGKANSEEAKENFRERFPLGADGAPLPPLALLKRGKPLPPPRDELPTDVANCGWEFEKYTPCEWEKVWYKRFNEIDQTMCLRGSKMWTDPELQPFAQSYTDVIAEGRLSPNLLAKPAKPGDKDACENWVHPQADLAHPSVLISPPLPGVFPAGSFSWMDYVFKCKGGDGDGDGKPKVPLPKGAPAIGARQRVYIEALAGVLRHPRTCEVPTKEIPDPSGKWRSRRDWLLTDTWTIHRNDAFASRFRRPRFLFYDLGATTWSFGHGGEVGQQAPEEISSQNWFHALYANKHCAPFDRMFLYEVTEYPRAKVFDPIPGHVLPKYHWINRPAQVDVESWDNPWNHVLSEASEADFVVMKLDVDHPGIENPLMDTLLATPELMRRVDEFYFEHHVRLKIMMACCWGDVSGSRLRQDASLRLFTKLRQHGMRAHSWI